MIDYNIQNIVFDVGNVILQWDPVSIVKNVFPDFVNFSYLVDKLFFSETWIALNEGKISEKEVINIYQSDLNLDIWQLEKLMKYVKESLIPIENSIDLIIKLHEANYKLYILTNNTMEIMSYLKEKYDFWNLFCGIVVSSDIRMRKPLYLIYKYLLDRYSLIPEETIFIDDLEPNIKSAELLHMNTILFKDVDYTKLILKSYGVCI